MLAHRNAAAVVLDGDRPVEVDHHVDAIAEAGQRLVDRVVDDLVDHVVQARPVIGVADVHAGPLANGIQTLQDLDALFVVLTAGGRLGRFRAAAGGRFGRRHEQINCTLKRTIKRPAFKGAD